MRTLTAWLLALALALGCAPGLAQSREETCATVFETEAPSLLLPALEALGYAPGDVRCGALWEYTPCVYALIALERDGVRTLAGAVLDLDGVWRTENLGEKMLLPGRDFRIVFRNPVGARPAIYVEYAPLNGVTERYGFSYEYWLYGEVLWRVDSYQREEADGDGYAITRYPYEGFCMRSLAEPDSPSSRGTRARLLDGLLRLHRRRGQLPHHLGAGPDPGQKQHASLCRRRLGAALWQRKPARAAHRAFRKPGPLPWGPRAQAGRKARQGRALGACERGRRGGLCKRRIRHSRRHGRVSSKHLSVPHSLGPRGRAHQPVRQPGGPAAARLAQGAMMYVMGKTDTGWLHVTLPSDGEMRCQMDLDGQSGYVRAQDVTVGSAATLDKNAQ